jgi:hypothetical protein
VFSICTKTDLANSKAELLKWAKAAKLAKKDKNYLQFINEIDNESAAIKETIHLLSSKTNRDRLSDAIEQIENSQFTKRELSIE